MLFVLLLKMNARLRCVLRCLGLCVSIHFLMSPMISQENVNTKNKDIDSKEVPARESHITGRIVNDHFTVNNLSFFRRYEETGKGELLEVMFSVTNKTLKTLDLKLFIVGFNEKSGVNSEYRKRVPYPTWRKRDFEKKCPPHYFS